MALPETFEAIRPSVVAFISRIGFAVSGEEPPIFPHIVGTGFFVHEKGIVATNRHVIEAIEKENEAYSPDLLNGHRPIGALVFTKINAIGAIWEIGVLNVDVMGWNSLNGFSSDDNWFGETNPDLGFVQLKVRDVPALTLATKEGVKRIV